MARLPYVEISESSSSPELARIHASIVGQGRSVHNHHRALANRPAVLKAFTEMSHFVRDESTLSPRLRELIVLASAYALNVTYEIHYHVPLARRVGVSEAQVAAFPDWAAADCFDPAERAILSYTDQVSRRLDVDDATFEALRAHFSQEEIVDVVFTAAWYLLCAAVTVPLGIEPEAEHA